MDIEFIEEQYRDDIFKLMEVCGIQMAEAYQLYLNAGNNFEAAMNMHFNGTSTNNNKYQPAYEQNYSNNPKYEHYENNAEGDDFDTLYQKYKIYKQGGQKFENRYEIRNQTGLIGGIVSKFWKGNQQSNFKKLLQSYFGKPTTLKFLTGSLSSALASSQKFPVIVYILDFSSQIKPKVQQILRNAQFSQVANVQYKNFGIDKSYQIEKSLIKFVDPKKYNNSLVILRVNAVEQIQTIQTISLATTTLKEALQKLKLAKNACISKDLDDGHLQRRFNQQLMGNFDYEKPMSIAQRRKAAQDRQIRKKQEEEFYASMKVQQQKQRKNSLTNGDKIPTNQPPQKTNQNSFTNKQANQPVKKQAPKRDLGEQRRRIREGLKAYTSGMNIKLRLPNGQAKILTVDPSQKGKYLYDYVLGIQGDIGFQKDADRKFDIIRPYDKLSLVQKLSQPLSQIFEGSDSQNLVVSERD